MARPTTYTPELAERICDLVATNTCGIDILCDKYDDLPNESTVRLWRFKHSEFSMKYAQAKMFQAELMAEMIHQIADSTSTYFDSEGNERVDSGSVALARLRVDSIKWHASKLAPKIYGDKQQTDTTVTLKHEESIKDLA
jgi:hypothetical protein